MRPDSKHLAASTFALVLLSFSFLTVFSLVPQISASPSCSTYCITISAQFGNGTAITGMYMELQNSHGNDIKAGYSPITFTVTPGQQYLIYANDWKHESFQSWAYPSTSADPIRYGIASNASKGDYTLTAIYTDPHGPSTTTTSSTSSTTRTTTTVSSSSTRSSLSTSSTSTTATSTVSSSTSQGAHLGLIVPLYAYPGPLWTQLIQAKEANPTVPVIAIINPDSGAGSSKDPTIANGVKELQAAGIIVYGYTETNYGSTPTSGIERQISEYVSWYGVNGAFLDEFANNNGYESYYSTLTSYANSLGIPTIGNPGWSDPCAYTSTVGGEMIYETDGLPTASFLQTGACGAGPGTFSFIATEVSSLPSLSYLDSVTPYVGYVYITASSPSYMDLPSYLSQEMNMLAQTP